ncbi:MAG: helix-turn-helix domain-containing protein [Planctomycetes bacterium]|nr:helix-turn-helix domain-containing protein [Planctomycetota bacterium]
MVTVTKDKAMYTVREAAAILCVTPRTVRGYIKDHKLRTIQRGQGYYLVHANDLRVFLGLDPDETLATVSIPDG